MLMIALLKIGFKSSCTSMYIPVQNQFSPGTHIARNVLTQLNYK